MWWRLCAAGGRGALALRPALRAQPLHRGLFCHSRPTLHSQFQHLIKKEAFTLVRLSSNGGAKKSTKAVGYWLLTCSGMVFVAVVLGTITGYLVLLFSICYVLDIIIRGVTRLTESGLSMVSWKLLGEKMPRTEQQWQEEFQKYQQFPEYQIKNKEMTLGEFKYIWWMEYGHRMWGRCIGAAVFLPTAFFWARGHFDKGMKVRSSAYCLLVGAQGLMGWYMVKSGLEDRFQGPSDVPRVSQYRLAAHLSLAFVLYTGLLAGALRCLRAPLAGAQYNFRFAKVPELRSVTILAHSAKMLTFLTAVSGAFVAGLDAGLVYNSFPKMGDRWIPEDVLAITPWLKNFTENPTTVQLDHRILGTLTLGVISALWLAARKKRITPQARLAANLLGAMAWVQVTLGISTLLTYVPTHLAASHQSGSLVLLSLAIWLTHELKLLRLIPK